MAPPKKAIVKEVCSVGEDSQKIVATYQEEGFVPGKFLIVDTGLVTGEGKAWKRAYSLCSVDENNKEFTCVVKKLGTAGADYMHSLKEGDELTFSGPWGKFYDQGGDESLWLIATDTGITACQGYKNSLKEQGLQNFFWFRESDTYFLEEMLGELEGVERVDVSPVGDAARIDQILEAVKVALETNRPQKIAMAGDGDVLLALKDCFLSEGFEEDQIQVELFF